MPPTHTGVDFIYTRFHTGDQIVFNQVTNGPYAARFWHGRLVLDSYRQKITPWKNNQRYKVLRLLECRDHLKVTRVTILKVFRKSSLTEVLLAQKIIKNIFHSNDKGFNYSSHYLSDRHRIVQAASSSDVASHSVVHPGASTRAVVGIAIGAHAA